jgi:hypothetical protein
VYFSVKINSGAGAECGEKNPHQFFPHTVDFFGVDFFTVPNVKI